MTNILCRRDLGIRILAWHPEIWDAIEFGAVYLFGSVLQPVVALLGDQIDVVRGRHEANLLEGRRPIARPRRLGARVRASTDRRGRARYPSSHAEPRGRTRQDGRTHGDVYDPDAGLTPSGVRHMLGLCRNPGVRPCQTHPPNATPAYFAMAATKPCASRANSSCRAMK